VRVRGEKSKYHSRVRHSSGSRHRVRGGTEHVHYVSERGNRGGGAVVRERKMMRRFQDGRAAHSIRHVVIAIDDIGDDDIFDEKTLFRGA
jgi:hypothetical protein